MDEGGEVSENSVMDDGGQVSENNVMGEISKYVAFFFLFFNAQTTKMVVSGRYGRGQGGQ